MHYALPVFDIETYFDLLTHLYRVGMSILNILWCLLFMLFLPIFTLFYTSRKDV